MPNKDQLIATWALLTTLPAPKTTETSTPALHMLPLVGLMLGLFFYMVAWLISGLPGMIGGSLILLVWIGSAGMLHLDGLADLSDALAAAHQNQNKFTDVLKAPDIGSAAVVTLILLLLIKLAALSTLFNLETLAPLLLIPAWARLGAAWWAQELPPLHEGLATWLLDAGEANLMPWLAILLLLSLLFAPALCFAPLLLWAWKQFLATRVHGMNGDCLGAGIEICEAGLLLLCCVVP